MRLHVMNNEIINEEKNDKWDFSDYAFTITGIIVVGLLVVPEIIDSLFEINIFGGSLSNMVPEVAEGLEEGQGARNWSIYQFRALSPLLFLLTTTIVFFKEAFDARKNGGYKGSMFTHTFESLFEDAIYMSITTIIVYGAVFFGAMYASWLAGPIAWILFIIIFPLVRKKTSDTGISAVPRLSLLIFVVGVIIEIVTRAWIAFPLTWLIICVLELIAVIRGRDFTIDNIFEIIYYTFSIILLALGVGFDFWIASWAAFPIAILICWIISKIIKPEGARE